MTQAVRIVYERKVLEYKAIKSKLEIQLYTS